MLIERCYHFLTTYLTNNFLSTYLSSHWTVSGWYHRQEVIRTFLFIILRSLPSGVRVQRESRLPIRLLLISSMILLYALRAPPISRWRTLATPLLRHQRISELRVICHHLVWQKMQKNTPVVMNQWLVHRRAITDFGQEAKGKGEFVNGELRIDWDPLHLTINHGLSWDWSCCVWCARRGEEPRQSGADGNHRRSQRDPPYAGASGSPQLLHLPGDRPHRRRGWAAHRQEECDPFWRRYIRNTDSNFL